jgi:hypothetical protein
MKHKNTRKIGLMETVMAITSIVSAVSSVAGFFGQKKATGQAAAAEDRRAALESRLNDVNAQKARIAQMKEARIKRAQIVTSTAGAGLGGMGTSSSVGGIGAVSSSEAGNIFNINRASGFASAIGQAKTDYATAAGESAGWQSISNAGSSIFTAAGGFKTLFNIPSMGK